MLDKIHISVAADLKAMPPLRCLSTSWWHGITTLSTVLTIRPLRWILISVVVDQQEEEGQSGVAPSNVGDGHTQAKS